MKELPVTISIIARFRLEEMLEKLSKDLTSAPLNERMAQLADCFHLNEKVDTALEDFRILFDEHKSYMMDVQEEMMEDGSMRVSKKKSFNF